MPCVQSVLIYGSETWTVRVEDVSKLERAERMMVRWMCGVTLRDRIASVELYSLLSIEEVGVVLRRGGLGGLDTWGTRMCLTGCLLAGKLLLWGLGCGEGGRNLDVNM